MKKTLTLLAFVAIAMTINAQTTDMKMLAVRGPVKRIVYTEGDDPILGVDVVHFNRNGLITRLIPFYEYSPNDYAEIKRNSYNMMKSWQIYYGDTFISDAMRRYEYFYGSNGYVNKIDAEFWESGFEADLTWDETGRLKFFVAKGGAELLEYTFISTYDYIETDRYGNWISVEITTASTEIYEDDYDNVERSTSTRRITRRIEYYE